MKYEYITATGKSQIEVDERFHDILLAMDREDYNSDRKHSRRYPLSLSNAVFDGDWMADRTDILGELIRSEAREHLHRALATLTPEQQTLVTQVYMRNEKIIDIARRDGVSEAAIRDRLKKIYSRLRKILV